MAFTKDLWHRPGPIGANGKPSRLRTSRYGKGKRWLAVWLDPDGEERSKAFGNKAEAELFARSQETDISRGDYIDPNAGKELLGAVAARWMASRVVDPASAVKYRTALRLHVEPTFGRRQVKGIKPSEVAAWLAGLNDRYGSSTARTALLVLQGSLDLAVADNSIKQNPAKSKVVQRPSTARESVHAWGDEVVSRVIDAHSPALRLVPVLAASCGLRQGEILGAAIEDFDFDERVLHVRRQVKQVEKDFLFALPKNDRERVVPLPDWTAQLVRVHAAAHQPRPYTLPWEKAGGPPRTANLLFRWPSNDQHVRARSYDELVWKPALAAAGVIPPPGKDPRGRKRYATDRRHGIHALRHYYASVTLADGVNIRELADYLGHTDPGFTLEIYAHLLPSSHDRARQAIDRRMFRPRAVADGTATEQSP